MELNYDEEMSVVHLNEISLWCRKTLRTHHEEIPKVKDFRLTLKLLKVEFFDFKDLKKQLKDF